MQQPCSSRVLSLCFPPLISCILDSCPQARAGCVCVCKGGGGTLAVCSPHPCFYNPALFSSILSFKISNGYLLEIKVGLVFGWQTPPLPATQSSFSGVLAPNVTVVFSKLYFVNLRTRDGTYIWEKVTEFDGQPPTPRDKLSCWVFKDR